MDRLFLDANVLFSAAYREAAGVTVLWSLEHVALSSSSYAVEEARRNLPTSEQTSRLERLLSSLQLVEAGTVLNSLRQGVELPEKDWPIVGGAMAAEATHLITGDVQHFGPYFHKRVGRILILPPAAYLREARRAF